MSLPDRDPDIILTHDQVFAAICEYLARHKLLKHNPCHVDANYRLQDGNITVRLWESTELDPSEPPIIVMVP